MPSFRGAGVQTESFANAKKAHYQLSDPPGQPGKHGYQIILSECYLGVWEWAQWPAVKFEGMHTCLHTLPVRLSPSFSLDFLSKQDLG